LDGFVLASVGCFGLATVERVVSEALQRARQRNFDEPIEGVIDVRGVLSLDGTAVGVVDKVGRGLVECVDFVALFVFGEAVIERVVGVVVRGAACFLSELVEIVVLIRFDVCLTRCLEKIADRVEEIERLGEKGRLGADFSRERIERLDFQAFRVDELLFEDFSRKVSFEIFMTVKLLRAAEAGDRLHTISEIAVDNRNASRRDIERSFSSVFVELALQGAASGERF